PRGASTRARTCFSLDDVIDAGRVAKKLGIPFEVIDLRKEFKELVIDDFITEYAGGRTPNPCIRCNERIKFDLLWRQAKEMGADYLATGHYAQSILADNGWYHLVKGADQQKDQSYFLFTLTQEQLARVIFPVGKLEKKEVRQLAASFGLPVAQKHESQEICFIPDNDYVRFLEKSGFRQPDGEIVTSDGVLLGRHRGIHRFTIGQRRGMGIPWEYPLHVIALDAEKRRVIVGRAEKLKRSGLIATGSSWTGSSVPAEFRADCQIRYRHRPASCRVGILADRSFEVHFDEPQTSITPGQAAVLYDEARVLGGGWIVSGID
ncbi:MAG: tRNA 2-thiouridine(34) synthase MnmA, partial [Deltaproteobacteria bacterium]|nr:tRNA 2-thiouridine(34) synthase MnmA [Deltaproteobacteria bacterium]